MSPIHIPCLPGEFLASTGIVLMYPPQEDTIRADRNDCALDACWPMSWLMTKYLITSAIVVLVSEFAKRSDKLGGLIAALPLVTLLTLIWLHYEQQSPEKIANHAWYTFWYVVPTLPMFLVFPKLLARLGFWPALLAGVLISCAVFTAFALVLRRVGIDLL